MTREAIDCDCDRGAPRRRRARRARTPPALLRLLVCALLAFSCVNGMHHMALQPPQPRDDYDEIDYEGSESEESVQSTFVDEHVKKLYQQQSKNYSRTTEELTPQTPHTTPGTTALPMAPPGCEGSCEDQAKLESAALDSIKKHLLMKLGLQHAPNITATMKLPRIILENFCISNKMPVEYCTGEAPGVKSLEYSNDEPANYPDEFGGIGGGEEGMGDAGYVEEHEEEVQYMSIENRIYAFPSTAVKYRHKSHLVFTFAINQEQNNAVVRAALNLFIHSRRQLEDAPSLKHIDVEVAEILSSEKHKLVFRVFKNVSVPEHGDGAYVQLDITELVAKWFTHHNTSHGLTVRITSSADGSKVPNRAVVLDADDMVKRPFIDILPRDQRKKRSKRSSLRCSKESKEKRCCRRELTVDFEKFGWDWIIAPKRYDANYCAGVCPIAFMQRYPHTYVMQISTTSFPCCAPRHMSPIQLLYFDIQLNVVLGTIPNMIVDDCFCS